MIDLKDIIRRNPSGATPIMGQWDCAFEDVFLDEVIDCLNLKFKMVECGVVSINPLEKFAALVLMSHYERYIQKIAKESLYEGSEQEFLGNV